MEQGDRDTRVLWRPDISGATILFLLLIFPCLIGFLAGFPPLLLIPLMISVAGGIILGIYRICDLFSTRSRRVAGQIGKIEALMGRHRALRTYGEFALILIMWIPGFGLYGTPVVAWILNWRGPRSILLMLTGWLVACLFVLTMTTGIRAILRW